MFRRSLVVIALGLVMLSIISTVYAAGNPDIIKLKKDLEITKEMTVNDVIVVDGDLAVLGRVDGNVVIVGGILALKSGSYVGGSVIVVGEIIKDPMAQVRGKITQIYIPRFIPGAIDLFRGGWVAFLAFISLMALIGFLCLSILLIALVPTHIGVIASSLERSFLSMFLWGLLWATMIVPVAIFLVISIIGIALVPLWIFLIAIALLIGYISSSLYVGNKISVAMNRKFAPFFSVIVGLILLFAIGLIPIAGAMVKAVFLIAGYGAVVTSRFGTSKELKQI